MLLSSPCLNKIKRIFEMDRIAGRFSCPSFNPFNHVLTPITILRIFEMDRIAGGSSCSSVNRFSCLNKIKRIFWMDRMEHDFKDF
jgi:hypothetical protein